MTMKIGEKSQSNHEVSPIHRPTAIPMKAENQQADHQGTERVEVSLEERAVECHGKKGGHGFEEG